MSPELLESVLGGPAVSPYREMVAYETLYAAEGASLKKIAAATVGAGLLPSQAAEAEFGMLPPAAQADVVEAISPRLGTFSVAVNGTPSWPDKIADSERPSPLLYYRGDIGLMDARSVAVVGSRKASEEWRPTRIPRGPLEGKLLFHSQRLQRAVHRPGRIECGARRPIQRDLYTYLSNVEFLNGNKKGDKVLY